MRSLNPCVPFSLSLGRGGVHENKYDFLLYMRLGSGLILYEGKVGLIGRGDPVTSNIEVSPGRIRRMDVLGEGGTQTPE